MITSGIITTGTNKLIQFTDTTRYGTSNETLPSWVSHITNQTIFAGYAGAVNCEVSLFETSSKTLNYTGFYGMYDHVNSSSIIGANTYTNIIQEEIDKSGNRRAEGNFVLEPGRNATIISEIRGHSGRCIGRCPPGLTIPTQLNFTNYDSTEFIHHENSRIEFSHYGLDVLYDPSSEIITNNGTVIIKATFAVSSDADRGTYWVALAPGNCNGGPLILLTIAN